MRTWTSTGFQQWPSFTSMVAHMTLGLASEGPDSPPRWAIARPPLWLPGSSERVLPPWKAAPLAPDSSLPTSRPSQACCCWPAQLQWSNCTKTMGKASPVSSLPCTYMQRGPTCGKSLWKLCRLRCLGELGRLKVSIHAFETISHDLWSLITQLQCLPSLTIW